MGKVGCIGVSTCGVPPEQAGGGPSRAQQCADHLPPAEALALALAEAPVVGTTTTGKDWGGQMHLRRPCSGVAGCGRWVASKAWFEEPHAR